MRERKAIRILLLFSAFILLTTCQLQFNKSKGNSLALQILIPGNASGGARGTPTLARNAKDLSGGTSVMVTITKEGATSGVQQSTSINGRTSIDFTFTLSSPGSYQVSALMLGASGHSLSQATAQFTLPTGDYPVVVTMPTTAASGGIQLAWGTDGSTFPNPITNASTSVSYPFEFSGSQPQIYYYQITNTSPTEPLGLGPLTITNNTSTGVFSVNVPPSAPVVPPSGTEEFEIAAAYIGGNKTYTETVTLNTSSTNPPDETFTFTVTDSQC